MKRQYPNACNCPELRYQMIRHMAPDPVIPAMAIAIADDPEI